MRRPPLRRGTAALCPGSAEARISVTATSDGRGAMDEVAARPARMRTIGLQASDGSTIEAFVAEPEGDGPWPAIVFGMEAMGLNRFGRRTAAEVAALGFVTITPDYYRGAGPSRPDDYDDFTEVIAAIGALDFGRATFDLLAAVDWARAQPAVVPDKVALWGYCTGATLAMLAAALDRKIVATLLFFPSQPFFPELSAKRPVHAWDLAWAIRSPVLVVSGGDDPILPPETIAELDRRLAAADVAHEIRVYQGAGHAFTGDARHMHHAAATADSWRVATAFLRRATD